MDRLVEKHLPILYKHLQKENIVPSMYVTEWVVTFYTRSFPFNFVVRVWDIFLHEKHWKVFYRIALALLKYFQHEFINSNFEQIMTLFRSIPLKVSDGKNEKKNNKNYLKKSIASPPPNVVEEDEERDDDSSFTSRDEKEQVADDIINVGLKIKIKRRDINELIRYYNNDKNGDHIKKKYL